MYFLHWLLVASLAILATSAPSTNDAEEAWRNFKATHGKQYKSILEERIRKENFVENLNKIAAHNQQYENGLITYSLKINEYSDMTPQEVKKMLNGYRKSKAAFKDVDVVNFVPDEDLEIPDEFDWREKGAVTPVKNQGQCGSCWAFSSTGALEGQYFRKTGKLVSISEQNLVDCSLEHNNKGCGGGDMNPAFTYVHNNDGIDSEDSYPYEAVTGKCRYAQPGNVTSTRGYATIENGNEEYLKAAIVTVGPIAVGIDASRNDFHSYSNGVYYNPYCSNGAIDPENELDHAVLAVGYGTENGQDYWLIKNSWGTSWGIDGYIKMARNRNNNCGVAAEASFPLNY